MTTRKTKPESRKQTRRAVSVRGETYDRVQAYCRKHKLTVSGFVEKLVADILGAEKRVSDVLEDTSSSKRDPEERPRPLTLVPKVDEAKTEDKAVRGGGTHLL